MKTGREIPDNPMPQFNLTSHFSPLVKSRKSVPPLYIKQKCIIEKAYKQKLQNMPKNVESGNFNKIAYRYAYEKLHEIFEVMKVL